MHIRQVVFRDERGAVQVDLLADRVQGRFEIGRLAGPHGLHGPLQQIHVQGEADGFDLPGLLLAQQFPSPADF